jgi:hypothetical protein
MLTAEDLPVSRFQPSREAPKIDMGPLRAWIALAALPAGLWIEWLHGLSVSVDTLTDSNRSAD